MGDIRVLLADDHAILREGLSSLLALQPDVKVVGEAMDGQEAVQKAGELSPDIVLMDITMPVMDGLEATRRIKELYPEVIVLILTQHDNREYVKALLQAGASGYVLKRSGGHQVITAIRQVYEQGTFLEADVARRLLDDYTSKGQDSKADTPHLTEREREVLRLVAEGKTNKEIAHLLTISPKTVSVHRTNIMSKLNLRNSVELVRHAVRHAPYEDPEE